ncbi:dynamin family protein [Microbacterium sp. NPDC089696]|uniref:dynamin family protein n=1 Tax=Microbacterium sp. NPDC089696 TaxID=3364199 RepID=UPI00380B2BD3
MTAGVREIVEDLLRVTRASYAKDVAALRTIDELDSRFREPLRLALAGMVKAGKSTLLNAMLGEQIAPTDTGECTRVVTWYRYSATPTITLHPRSGTPRRMPIHRERGRLVLDLDGLTAEQVEWIDVGWPLQSLTGVTLIDTPGIASLSEDTSARAARFLTPDEAPPEADAVVYLLRHLHGSDVKFLRAFQDASVGQVRTVCAVGVLSRSDEVGSGRIDSLLSARKIARRFQLDQDLASLTLGVVPVAGLLAEGARTLRESEYIAFRELAGLERADRERLLVSADRFVRDSSVTGLSATVRRDLLARFGIFGVRMAVTVIRGGARSSSELASELIAQSGLVEIQDLVGTQLQSRAETLKARGIVLQVERLLRERPLDDAAAVRAGIERFRLAAHALRELELLADAGSRRLPLEDGDAEEAARIVGGEGTDAHRRLGESAGADASTLGSAVNDRIAHWRRLTESPLADAATRSVARVVVRSLEGVASEIGASAALWSAPAHVDASSGPGDGSGKDAAEQREEDERRLRRDHRVKLRAVFSQRDPLR